MALDWSGSATSYRRPWYWLVVIGVLACALTALTVVAARERTAANHRAFVADQQLRLQRAGEAMEDFIGDALQLVDAAADTLGPMRGDRALVERLLHGLTQSHANSAIWGMGIFYAPNVFGGATKLYGPYERAGPPSVLIRNDERNFQYTNTRWYRDGAQAGKSATIEGPYDEDGRSFISVLRAYRDADERLAAVASVDTRKTQFTALVQRELAAGDVAFVTNRNGDTLYSTGAPVRAEPRIEITRPVRYTHSTLHLSSDASALAAANARLGWLAAGVIVFIWGLAALLSLALGRMWAARKRTIDAELREGAMRRELDVQKQIEAELRRAAYTDGLTGLPNRTPFFERVSASIASLEKGSPEQAVFFIDLDRFNLVNDTLGHLAGDELLRVVARRLREFLPDDAMVARLGGDEFVVLRQCARGEAAQAAEQILSSLREPILLGGRVVYPSASIGIVCLDRRYAAPEELLRDADIAMYEAKHRGRAGAALFDTEMRRRVAAESELEEHLMRSIERGDIVPHYQPIVKIDTGEIVSFEALARWDRRSGPPVAAGEFVGYAERHGFVDLIDKLMLENVCRDAAALFAQFPSATVAVNLSASHLTAPGLSGSIAKELAKNGVRPDRLKFEITETAIMTSAGTARETLDALARDGMQIVLDDFGAGHSSLGYLHQLPIAGVKIDRSFVTPLPDDPAALAIVRSIVALARTLGLYVVAEGVETAQQRDALAALDVAYAQGFFFSKPADLAQLLTNAKVATPSAGT